MKIDLKLPEVAQLSFIWGIPEEMIELSGQTIIIMSDNISMSLSDIQKLEAFYSGNVDISVGTSGDEFLINVRMTPK